MTNFTKSAVLEAQLTWAQAAGLEPDKQGYLDNLEDNLFQPLSAKAREGLSQGNGSELIDKDGEKAKFRALHSSSALAVNVFDQFMDNDRSALVNALGLDCGITSLAFEEKFPTGLRGTPPNLDVVLRMEDGTIIGIESKFTEWMGAAPGKAEFRESYFPEGNGLWEDKGLPDSQRLAEAMHAGEASFSHLNAMQLLKHALGLANKVGSAVHLFYIFFDCPGEESKLHWVELDRFAAAVGQELGFHAISYQALFRALQTSAELDSHYLNYLGSRFFPERA